MKKYFYLMAAAIMVLGFTACTIDNNDNPVTEPVEYGKVFSYTYNGQTLYYIIEESGEAIVEYPMYPGFDTRNDESWTGYDKPEGSVVIPDYVPCGGNKYPVTEVDYCAFFRCYDITSVTLPSTLRTIDKRAFNKCYSLESINLPNTLQSIGNYALLSTKINNVVIPDHLKQLGDGLFMYCDSLTTCQLPTQLEAIGIDFFYGSGITNITIPEHVTSIGSWAFGNCLSLKELTLPASVTELADYVFTDGTRLETLTVGSEVPPTVTPSTFEDYATTIIVPKGTGDAYRSDEIWGKFTTITEKE